MASENWHYEDRGSAVGPVAAAEMLRLIGNGLIRAETLVWRRGLAGWEAAKQHFDFATRAAPRAEGQPAGFEGPAMSERARRYMQKKGTEPARDETQEMPYRPRGDGLYHLAPGRGFLEAIRVCLGKYFTFSGRASRSEYWYFMLFNLLVSLLAAWLDFRFIDMKFDGSDTGPVGTAVGLLMFIPMLAVTWRRLHDTGRSGWWIGGFWLACIAWVAVMFLSLVSVPVAVGLAGNLLALTVVAGLASVIYSIALLVMLCTRGNPGPNRFG